jgi:hypothetical protein
MVKDRKTGKRENFGTASLKKRKRRTYLPMLFMGSLVVQKSLET